MMWDVAGGVIIAAVICGAFVFSIMGLQDSPVLGPVLVIGSVIAAIVVVLV